MLELGAGGDEALDLARPPLRDALRVGQLERRELAVGQRVVDPRVERERAQVVAREGVPRGPGRKGQHYRNQMKSIRAMRATRDTFTLPLDGGIRSPNYPLTSWRRAT